MALDLAVEVISEEVEAKRIAFLQAGTRLLWVIYPEARTVHVYGPSSFVAILTESDELRGEDVVQGFVCRVAELFADL